MKQSPLDRLFALAERHVSFFDREATGRSALSVSAVADLP